MLESCTEHALGLRAQGKRVGTKAGMTRAAGAAEAARAWKRARQCPEANGQLSEVPGRSDLHFKGSPSSCVSWGGSRRRDWAWKTNQAHSHSDHRPHLPGL